MSLVAQMADAMGAGWAVEFAEVYLDESESDNHRWLIVAGWAFSKEGREALHREWFALLSAWGLPYFHMGPCTHGNPPFDRFTDPERDVIARQFFEVLKRHAIVGFASSYDLRLAHLCPHAVNAEGKRLFHVTPYSLSCYWALLFAKNWADKIDYRGRIAYFFEAGHQSKQQANRLMGEIFSAPALKDIFRYGGHGFVIKQESAAVQCADILAWQWSKNVKERAHGNMKPRADLLALLEAIPTNMTHFDEPTILGFLNVVRKNNAMEASSYVSGAIQEQ